MFVSFLGDALAKGLVTEKTIRESVKPLFYTRMKLGEFDPPHMNPYSYLNMSVVQSVKHQELAVKAALQTFVLLKNDHNILPLTKYFSRIAVSRIFWIFFFFLTIKIQCKLRKNYTLYSHAQFRNRILMTCQPFLMVCQSF